MGLNHFIHRFVPSGNASASYTLLMLHGTGGNEDDLLSLGGLFGKNINLLSLRGNVPENGKPRFFRRISEGVFDVDDLKLRTTQLREFVLEAATQYNFDIKKVVAIGYSNGANITGSLLLMYPELLAGAILFRPMIPFESNGSLQLPGLPVFISSGDADFVVKSGESKTWADILSNAGAEVEYHIIETGHNLSQQDFELSILWYRKNFGEEKNKAKA